MATMTTAATVAARTSEKESLSTIIARISPEDVPVMSNMKKASKGAVLFDFQVEELAAAGANAQAEGAAIGASDAVNTDTTRLQNQHQIAWKAYSVSDTQDAVDHAGFERQSARQALLKGLELRRDIEYALTHDQAKSTSGNRKAGTLSSFIANTSLPSDASKTGTFAANGSDLPIDDAATDTTPADGMADDFGTARAISVALVESAMQDAYTQGGMSGGGIMVVSPVQKKKFSDATIANYGTGTIQNQFNQTSPTAPTAVGSVSAYLTDFGTIQTVISRQMPTERAYLLDPEYAEYTTLNGRDMVKEEVGKSGDATTGYVLSEFSLAVTAPKAHSAIYGLTTS